MKALILSLLAFVSVHAHAASPFSIFAPTYAPSPATLASVNLATGATLTVGGTNANLTLFGAGRRTKIITVYVGQFFSDQVWTAHSEADLLPLIDRSSQVALMLTMKLGLSDSEIKTAFSERLQKNGVSLTAPQIDDALTKLSSLGGLNRGQSVVIAAIKNSNQTETIYIQKEGKPELHVDGPAGFAHQIFSIWLGVTADDSGLDSMKTEIIGH